MPLAPEDEPPTRPPPVPPPAQYPAPPPPPATTTRDAIDVVFVGALGPRTVPLPAVDVTFDAVLA
ncbi:unannotated protein [freshwater metagenome]|uniref:Unannotated protein n=1 Tax=freshwater metagenome TaxID=449393 RepID=A0A6J7PUC3_9ZZZZ